MKEPLLDTPLAERTTAAVLDRSVKASPNKLALIDTDGSSYSYQALQQSAFSISNALSELGVEASDHVMMMLETHSDNILCWLGITVGGMVHVPINYAYKGEMFKYAVEYCGSSVLIIEDKWLDRLDILENAAPNLKHVIVRGDSTSPIPDRFNVRSFSQLLEGETSPPAPPNAWDAASMIFTSGTTGNSKGVLCSHAHAFTMASFPPLEDPEEIVMVTLPLFHAAGLWAGTFNALRIGGTAVICSSFSVSDFFDQVRKYQVTNTILLGAQIDFLCRQPPSENDNNHTLRMAVVIPSPADATGLKERFGFEVGSGYGNTESGVVMVSETGSTRPLGCGRPRQHIEARLVDENDLEVPKGEVGELVVRSTEPWSMMLGYHQLPEATAKEWRNLWLHTGDAMYEDSDGQYVYVDRGPDVMRRRGENISSFEVERHILARDDIAEVAVVAVKSEHTEDELKAVVVLAENAIFDPDNILQDLYDRMPYFMVPRYLEPTSALPMTQTHKVQKKQLRDQGVTASTWDCVEAGYRVTRDKLVAPDSKES